MSSSEAANGSETLAPEAAIPPPAEPRDSSPRPAPAIAVERKRGRPILWTFIVLVSAFVGAAIARYALPDLVLPGQTSSTQMAADLADLRTQLRAANIEELRSRVGALERRPASGGADLAQFNDRLAAAEQATATLRDSMAALQPSPSNPGVAIPSDSLASVGNAVAALSNQIADLSAHLNATEAALKASDSAFGDRLEIVEQRVPADLAAQIGNLAAKGDLQTLDARIAALEANTAAIDAKRTAAAIALADLARAAGSGAPFQQELTSVQSLQVDQTLVAPIASFAKSGVKPQSEIIAAFDGAARAALRADRGSGGNWWARLWAHFSSLFAVRKTGLVEGNSAEAILSRAGARAHSENLNAALTELAALRGPAASAMADWQKQARARVELDRLVRQLNSTLLAALGPQAQP